MNLLKFFFKKQSVYGGLDISIQGISSFVMVFPAAEGCLRVIPRFWVPEDMLSSTPSVEISEWQEYVSQGYVQTIAGNVVDYNDIARRIKQEKKTYNIRAVAFDRWGSAQVSKAVEKHSLKVVHTGQGFASLSAPTKQLERLYLSEKIVCDNPVFFWMMRNMVILKDTVGNAKPDPHSKKSIGGAVAAIMAINLIQ